jgi:hypothetical protein
VLAMSPVTVVWVLWLGGALWYGAKKNVSLLWCPFVSAALLLAFANKAYNLGYVERYILFLVPIVCVLMGLAAEGAWSWLQNRNPSRVLKMSLAVAGVLLFLGLNANSLLTLADWYNTELRAGRSNAAYLAWRDFVASEFGAGDRVWLDSALQEYAVVLNASDVGTTLDYFLRMRGAKTEFVQHPAVQIPDSAVVIARFTFPLARTGMEESGRTLAVCVLEDTRGGPRFIVPGVQQEGLK